MLANGRVRPTHFPNQGTANIINAESSNSTFKFAQTSASFPTGTDLHENGLESLNRGDQTILDDLEEFIQGPKRQTFPNNNNNTNIWPNKMAAANTSGPSQQLSNTNGFQLPLGSSSALQNKAGSPGMNLSSSLHINNQLSSVLDQASGRVHSGSSAQANPSSSNVKLLPGGQDSPAITPTNQYNQFSQRQELLIRGFPAGTRGSPHEISSSPVMRAAPSEQYGSTQQRSYMSASNESQVRALNRQIPSPFSSNYFPQESQNTQSATRTVNAQSEERALSSGEHFQWSQNRFQTPSLCQPSNSSVQSMNRTQMQQPNMLQRRPPYLMMGSQHQAQPQTQQHPYGMMTSQMKPNPMQHAQQYYGTVGMGILRHNNPMVARQQVMTNQIQKPQQDFGSFQQQQFQHRYQQPQYPTQMPPSYMQSRQPSQPMTQNPSSMPRMQISHHQPILPKPSVEMFVSQAGASRYPNSMQESSLEFPGPIVAEQPPPPPPPQLHRQQSYPSAGSIGPPSDTQGRPSMSQGQYQRGYPPFPSPLRSGSSSPNVTMGSPMRSMAEGFTQSSAPPTSAAMPVTSFPIPPSSGNVTSSLSSSASPSTHTGAAAAAAAAVVAAANSLSRYSGMGQEEQGGSGHAYGSSQDSGSRSTVGVVRSPRSETSNISTASLAGMEGSTGVNSVETGRVPSPSLNQLPTAEDVEAMIKSMRPGDVFLDDNQASSQSSTPTSVSAAPSVSSQVPTRSSALPTKSERTGDYNCMRDSQRNLSESPLPGMVPVSATDSPLSSFSGLSVQAGLAGLSSPSSSFGDDDSDIDIPVDSITPTLGQASTSPVHSVMPYPLPSACKPSIQYAKFSQLYGLSDDPERKVFLDKYYTYMESSGTTVNQIPLVNNQPLDLFKFYKVVRENGGLREVVKKKVWSTVMLALDIPLHQTNCLNTLRTQYARFLLSYEMRDGSAGDSADDMLNNDLLEDSGIPPPNATATCSEAIIPSATVTTAQSGESSSQLPGYSQAVNSPQGYTTHSYRSSENYPEMSYDSSKGYPTDSLEPRHPVKQQPSSNSYNMPAYMFGNERSSYPNYPNRSYPPYHNSQIQLSGTVALSQLIHQRNQQQAMQGYPSHSNTQRHSSMMGPQQPMISSPSPQDQIAPMWGSQYNASAEPGQMFDYPPTGSPSQGMRPSMQQHQYPPTPPYNSFQGRQQSQYPPMPPQYHPSPSPHGQSSPLSSSMQKPPVTPSQQQQQPPPLQSSPKPKYTTLQHHTRHLKREISFPTDSVEATKPVFTKKRKLTSRDLGPVEAWRVMMSLKSGLLAETTWALDTLNILLYDDHTVGYFLLSHLPGLLDNLLDHFRRYLVEIFGSFLENEISIGAAFMEKRRKKERVEPDMEEKCLEEKLEEDVCRGLTAFIAASTIHHPEEGFASGAEDWVMGGSDTTVHIQTHIGTATSVLKQKCRVFISEDEESLEEKSEGNCELENKEYECKLEHVEEDGDIDTSVEDRVIKKEENLKGNCRCCSTQANQPVKIENCISGSLARDWDLDSEDSDSGSSSDLERASKKSSEPHKNDSCLSSEEMFTVRLKKELGLDIDVSPDEAETNAYIQSVIETKVQRDRENPVEEQESVRREDAPLCLRTEADDAVSRRCICVSNILRGLSFVPGNDLEMFRHSGLLLILGRLLLLCHKHAKRVPYRRTYMQEEVELDEPSDDRDDWWWHCLEVLRENALVIISNIAGQLDLTYYSESITAPILDGLLHWLVCQSADAVDPMPTATLGTSLSAQQLVLESLAKMSILGGNAELILSTPPASRLDDLYATLVRRLGLRENPVTRELTLVLLSNLSQTDSNFVSLGDKRQCIAMLLQFIEDAANAINAYSAGGALAQAGFHSEDFCGTSVDMLRRAASTLVCLARYKPNRALFLPFQERLLVLATLRLLESMIGSQLADVLFYLSR